MVRKKIKKFCAYAMAMVVMATSIAPPTMQNVYAASEDKGNPFGKNVAEGGTVTVSYFDEEGEPSKLDESIAIRTDTDFAKLVNGKTDDVWESQNYDSDPIRVKRRAHIVIDMNKINYIDHIVVYWGAVAPAAEYSISVSEDNENWNEVGSAKDGDGKVDFTFSPENARYVKLACEKAKNYDVYTISEIEAYTIGTVEEEKDISYALSDAVASSVDTPENGENCEARNAIDGKAGTRWKSKSADVGSEAWIYVDLKQEKTINQMYLKWEGAFASSYSIETTTDKTITEKTTWKKVQKDGKDLTCEISQLENEGEYTHDFDNTKARYVRVKGTSATIYGLAIFEMEIRRAREKIEVEEIYLSRTDRYQFAAKNDTLKLYAQKMPSNVEGDITWKSSDANVATVDQNGLVTAVDYGAATITASIGDKSQSIQVELIKEKLDAPKTVTAALSDDKKAINVTWDAVSGEGVTYEIEREDENAEDSNNIKKADSATTSYTDNDVEAGHTYTYKVRAVKKQNDNLNGAGEWCGSKPLTIPLAVSGVKLDKETVELEIAEDKPDKATVELKETVLPELAVNKSVTWESSDEKVATVNEGKVQAVAGGKATITVTTVDGGYTATCEVTVREKLATPVVTAKKTGSHEITLSWPVVEHAGSYKILRRARQNEDGVYEVVEENVDASVPEGEMVSYTDEIDSSAPGDDYRYKVVATPAANTYYTESNQSERTTWITIGVKNPFGINVALDQDVTVLSVDGNNGPEFITDGNVDGGWWESAKKLKDDGSRYDNGEECEYDQSCTINLDNTYKIDRVKIYWRAAATKFNIKTKVDGEEKEIKFVAKKDGDITDCIFENVESVQNIVVEMKESAGWGSYGIYEIEAFTPGTVVEEGATDAKNIIFYRDETIKLNKNESSDIYAQILPSNATDEITWISSNQSVVKITPDEDIKGHCNITGKNVGFATITAKAGEHEATCTVLVTQKLGTPTNVTGTLAADEKSITVTWKAVEDAASYTLYRIVNGTAEETPVAENLTATTYEDKNVGQSKKYRYQVVAVNPTIATADDATPLYVNSDKSDPSNEVTVPIHVTKIELNETDVKLVIGDNETVQLTPTVSPSNATEQGVEWISDKPEIASVDQNGKVTAKSPGTAKITAKSKDEKSTAKAECTVTVSKKLDDPVVIVATADDADGISITISFAAVAHAGSYKLYRSVDGADMAEILNAVSTPSGGKYSYTDTDLDSGKTYRYKVVANPESDTYYESEFTTEAIRFPIHVKGVSFKNDTKKELELNEQLNLKGSISIEPEDADMQDVTWTLSNDTVADIDNDGVLTAKAVGTVTITVTTKDGGYTATHTIAVKTKLEAPVINVALSGSNAVITWGEVDHASSYDVYESTDGKEFTKLDNTEGLSYTHQNISNGTHYYKVVAIGTGNYMDSAESNTQSVTYSNGGGGKVVKVTGINISKTNADINKGKTLKLTATVLPGNASNKKVTWSSSNKNVASVDQNGVVTAKAKGTAKITVTTVDGKKTASCTVTVKIPATKVTLQSVSKKIYMKKGNSVKVKASMTPSDTTDKITWKSSNTKVATVNSGKIKAKKKGTATITATATSGKKATITVNVADKATKSKSIKLNKKSVTIKVGGSYTLKATLKPSKSTDTIKWKSSSKKVATVDEFGVVKAKKAGKATITATTSSKKKYTCKVTVKK